MPLRFVGAAGHGVVYADRSQAALGERARFRLARLAHPVPAQLQRLALAGEHYQVPEADRAAFMLRYYPRLARMATMISSDGSFSAPEIRDPTLVLRVDYTDGHDVRIGWEWAYEVDGQVVRAPAHGDASADGIRDREAERRVLSGLTLPPALSTAGRGRPGWRGWTRCCSPRRRCRCWRGSKGFAWRLPGSRPTTARRATSLRIGVSADELDGDPDWFDLGITITVEGREVPFADVFVALASGQSHLLLPDGAYFSLDKPELAALAALIEEARALTDRPGGEALRISRFQAGLWDELAALGEVSRQARAWQQQVQGLLSADGIPRADPPRRVRARLRPYQLEGFQWLAFLWEHQLGGILADDMGLGKTLQTLALISHAPATAREKGCAGCVGNPFLIVAPTSVLPNWAAEAARFTPDLKVVTIGDTLARRGQSLDEVIAGADAVVISYTLLRLDFDDYGARQWSGLVMDEAQYVKNHQSKAYQCARKLPATGQDRDHRHADGEQPD